MEVQRLTGEDTGVKKQVDKKVDNRCLSAQHKSNTQLIYELVIGQHEATGGYKPNTTKIAKILGKSKQYVSKIILKLVKQGYLTCDNPRDKVKFYSPTKKSPKLEKRRLTKSAKNVTGSLSGMSTNFTGSSLGSLYSTSKSQWSCPVSAFNEQDLVGWKKMRLANGVVKYTKEWLFSDPFATVLHFQIVGKRNFTMTLTFPPVQFEDRDDFLGAEEYIRDYVGSALKFMGRKFHIGMNLRLVRLSTTDFEARLRNADVKNFIDTAQVILHYHHGKMYVGTLKFDGSGGIDKIESDVPQWIVDYIELPSFSQRLKEVEERIPKMIERGMQRVEEGLGRRFEELFSAPGRPDEKREVS